MDWQVVSHWSSNEIKFHMHWSNLNMFLGIISTLNQKKKKTTFKAAFTIYKCAKCWPVWSSPLWSTENFVVYLLPWVGFGVTYTNNVCDVRHDWKFMNTLCKMFCLNHGTMKKKRNCYKNFWWEQWYFYGKLRFFLKSELGLRNL